MTDGSQLDLFGGNHHPPPDDSPSGLKPNPAHPPGVWLGTCSYTHAHWRGTFYPKGLRPADELAYYARYHNAAEIDSSFYGVPQRATVERWVKVTPPDFRFALKAPKSLTHEAALSLDDEAASRDWEALLALAPLFHGRLGAILLQLGPRVTADTMPRLERVLRSAGPIPLAVEFRHASWARPEATHLLQTHGAARTWTDAYLDRRHPEARQDPTAFDQTAGFLYIRLLGDVSTKYGEGSSLNHRYGSILFDRSDDLPKWIGRLAAVRQQGIPGMCFVNNHYEGFSPLTVAAIRRGL